MGTPPLAQWLETYRANRATIRASLQPAQPGLVVAGTVIAIGAFVASFFVGDAGEVVRDLAVQGAVLAGLAFVPGPWAERQAVILCVGVLVGLDVIVAGAAGAAGAAVIDKSTAGTMSSLVLIVQALSPLLLRFGNEMRLLAKRTKATLAVPPEERSQIRLEDLE